MGQLPSTSPDNNENSETGSVCLCELRGMRLCSTAMPHSLVFRVVQTSLVNGMSTSMYVAFLASTNLFALSQETQRDNQ